MRPSSPLNETDEERFKRVAKARTQAVLNKLRLLGNCSNRRLYSYTDQEVEKIFNAINGQVASIKSKFTCKNTWDIDL